MKKLFIFVGLVFLGCETGVEINLECLLKHTTEVVKMEANIVGEKSRVIVNLTWTWTYQRPEIDGVIVERSIGDSLHYITLDTVPVDTGKTMTFFDSDTLLKPEDLVYYRLSSLYGNNVDTFKVVDIKIPSAQKFYQPAVDTISNDTLVISYKRLTDFSDYKIEIFKAVSNQFDSLFSMEIESLLVKLTSPLFDTTITDTAITIPLPDSIFSDTTLYAIKLSSSKILELITDTSIGLRPFFKKWSTRGRAWLN